MRPLALFLFAVCCAAQNAVIRLDDGVFRVSPVPIAAEPEDGWPSLFAVYAGEGDVPPVLGSYSLDGRTLTFRPRFPMSSGMHLRAVLHLPGASEITSTFDLPKAAPPVATTRVQAIYPSANVLPANQLKFYIYFTAPMAKGEVWSRVHLLRDDGSPVELPFLELDQELWDRDNRRVTLLLDPGRIKRGLASLAEAGPALEEGRHYILLVDRNWSDGRGAPMAEEFRKSFQVSAADRNPPQLKQWRVIAPRAGSSDPLVIDFPKPLDYALLQHMLAVAGKNGRIDGAVAVDREEKRWSFTPTLPWTQGQYQIVVQTALEDLAGNHIGRPFDVDTFDPITHTVTTETLALPFRIR